MEKDRTRVFDAFFSTRTSKIPDRTQNVLLFRIELHFLRPSSPSRNLQSTLYSSFFYLLNSVRNGFSVSLKQCLSTLRTIDRTLFCFKSCLERIRVDNRLTYHQMKKALMKSAELSLKPILLLMKVLERDFLQFRSNLVNILIILNLFASLLESIYALHLWFYLGFF